MVQPATSAVSLWPRDIKAELVKGLLPPGRAAACPRAPVIPPPYELALMLNGH